MGLGVGGGALRWPDLQARSEVTGDSIRSPAGNPLKDFIFFIGSRDLTHRKWVPAMASS